MSETPNVPRPEAVSDKISENLRLEENESQKLHRYWTQKRFQHRLTVASNFELAVWFLPLVYGAANIAISILNEGTLPSVGQAEVMYLIVLFLVIFSALISSFTPLVLLVSALAAKRNPALKQGFATGVVLSQSGVTPSGNGNRMEIDLDFAFSEYVNRSRLATSSAQRRPNTLLFVGTIIAVGGLIFFVYTLPVKPWVSGQIELEGINAAEIISNVVPRLLMLLFIQVLAGFFLRQYRSSMEEFRYYEGILRHREAQHLSYRIRASLDDKDAVRALAETVLSDLKPELIEAGQTTHVLEAQKAERNEMMDLVNKVVDLVPKPQSKSNEKPSSP